VNGDAVFARLEQTIARLKSLDERFDFLERSASKGLADVKESLNNLATSQDKFEMRVATELVSLADVTRQVRDLLERGSAR
jgi:hypothetical protein